MHICRVQFLFSLPPSPQYSGPLNPLKMCRCRHGIWHLLSLVLIIFGRTRVTDIAGSNPPYFSWFLQKFDLCFYCRSLEEKMGLSINWSLVKTFEIFFWPWGDLNLCQLGKIWRWLGFWCIGSSQISESFSITDIDWSASRTQDDGLVLRFFLQCVKGRIGLVRSVWSTVPLINFRFI